VAAPLQVAMILMLTAMVIKLVVKKVEMATGMILMRRTSLALILPQFSLMA